MTNQVDRTRVMMLFHQKNTPKEIAVMVGCSLRTIHVILAASRRVYTETQPLSPAMRHLAQFDTVIGARLAREECES